MDESLIKIACILPDIKPPAQGLVAYVLKSSGAELLEWLQTLIDDFRK